MRSRWKFTERLRLYQLEASKHCVVHLSFTLGRLDLHLFLQNDILQPKESIIRSVSVANIRWMALMDRSLSFGESSSLANHSHTKSFGPSATSTYASSHYANYDFIAVLGLAQRLRIRFLSVTWQAALGPLGRGGQASVYQALADVRTSFAFKRFHHPDCDPFRETVQEMVVLSHPVLRDHKHIIALEGICWDIPEDDRVWPVLVFLKSHFGDLYSFAKWERFKDLSIEDKLNLCADIGIAIKDMHRNGDTLYR